MRLAIKETRVRGSDPEAVFAHAAELGCAAIQIHLPDDERLAAIRRAMAATGVGVAAVGAMHCGMLGPDPAVMLREHRQVERALWAAAELGAPVVSQFAGWDHTVDLAANADRWAECYLPHARLAERLGLRIAFENCPMIRGGRPRNLFYCPAHWDACFAACDHPALAIEFDVGHFASVGIDPLPLVARYAQRIANVHLKDVVLDRAATQERGLVGGIPHAFAPVGRGEVDVAALLGELRRCGYAGSLTADYERPDEAAIAANLDGIRRAAERAGIPLGATTAC